MVFVGHLDTMRLFERACHRAALPLTHDKSPFRARPRIATALPLPLGASVSDDNCTWKQHRATSVPCLSPVACLACCNIPLMSGATSDAEVLELLLTRPLPLEELRSRLQEQLPAGVQLLGAREVPIFKADGSNYEKLGALLERVEYHVLLTRAAEDAAHAEAQSVEQVSLAEAVAAAIASPVYSKPVRAFHGLTVGAHHQTHRIKSETTSAKTWTWGMPCWRWTCCETRPPAPWRGGRATCCTTWRQTPPWQTENGAWCASRLGAFDCNTRTARCTTDARCAGGNPVVTPSVLCAVLARASGVQWNAAHVHRSAVGIGESALVAVDHARLRSILLWEGHVAMERLWRGTGPWAEGIEGRPMAASSKER